MQISNTVNHPLSGHPSYGHVRLPGRLASIIRVIYDFKCALIREGFTLLTHHPEVFEDRYYYGFLYAAAKETEHTYINKKLDIIEELKQGNQDFPVS